QAIGARADGAGADLLARIALLFEDGDAIDPARGRRREEQRGRDTGWAATDDGEVEVHVTSSVVRRGQNRNGRAFTRPFLRDGSGDQFVSSNSASITPSLPLPPCGGGAPPGPSGGGAPGPPPAGGPAFSYITLAMRCAS